MSGRRRLRSAFILRGRRAVRLIEAGRGHSDINYYKKKKDAHAKRGEASHDPPRVEFIL